MKRIAQFIVILYGTYSGLSHKPYNSPGSSRTGAAFCIVPQRWHATKRDRLANKVQFGEESAFPLCLFVAVLLTRKNWSSSFR